MVALRGHFDGKAIVLDDPADLPQGKALIVHVEVESLTPPPSEIPALDWIIQNAVEGSSVPVDGATQHDHYLYGVPKRPGLRLGSLSPMLLSASL